MVGRLLSGDLLINTHTRLYEGASCSTTDLDAQSRRSFIVAGIPGNTGSNGDKWTVNSDGNKVTVTLVVRNDLHCGRAGGRHAGRRPAPPTSGRRDRRTV